VAWKKNVGLKVYIKQSNDSQFQEQDVDMMFQKILGFNEELL